MTSLIASRCPHRYLYKKKKKKTYLSTIKNILDLFQYRYFLRLRLAHNFKLLLYKYFNIPKLPKIEITLFLQTVNRDLELCDLLIEIDNDGG